MGLIGLFCGVSKLIYAKPIAPYLTDQCHASNSYYDSYNYYFHGLSKIINANFCIIFFHDLRKCKFSFQCNDRGVEESRTYKYILNGHG